MLHCEISTYVYNLYWSEQNNQQFHFSSTLSLEVWSFFCLLGHTAHTRILWTTVSHWRVTLRIYSFNQTVIWYLLFSFSLHPFKPLVTTVFGSRSCFCFCFCFFLASCKREHALFCLWLAYFTYLYPWFYLHHCCL